ncbi:MAG: hypothetical protein ACP5VN_07570 [Acidobacteriota bacterium]
MTPERLFFAYLGWSGPGPEGTSGGRWMTLFSTDWKGGDVQVYEEAPEGSPEADAAGLWNAYSWWAEWPGRGWVLARTLPPRLYLFSEEGKLLKRFPAEDSAGPPPLPRGGRDRTFELLAMDRVIGLVPAGRFLGVVWLKRHPEGATLRIEWLDEAFRKVGEGESPFPHPLVPREGLEVAETRQGRGAILLLRRMTGDYTQVTELYEWPFLWKAAEKAQPRSPSRPPRPLPPSAGMKEEMTP